jgi:hypothetical protein
VAQGDGEYRAGEDIFFEILNPDSLKYTYKARLAQNFGSNFVSNHRRSNQDRLDHNCTKRENLLIFISIGLGLQNETIYKIPMVIVEPSDACSSVVNPMEVRDNIGLVERGGCSFLSKCIEAEQSGMNGIIVFDNNDSNDDQYIDMVDDTTSRNCSIPAAFLLGRDGFMIRRQMMYLGLRQVIINIPVNMTLVPLEDHRNPPWVFY